MAKPRLVRLTPGDGGVITVEREDSRDDSMRDIDTRLNSARAVVCCVAGALRGCESAKTDEDVVHAAIALRNLGAALTAIQEDLDRFTMTHIYKMQAERAMEARP